MSVAEAWQSGRPIFSRMPGVNGRYNTPDTLPDWLTEYWDTLLVSTKVKIDEISTKQLKTSTADPEWLDFLAPLCGWDSIHWNQNWSAEAKRTILANSYSGQSIWETKGSLETLSFVLSAVGIRNIVRLDSDFIIGTSTVGSEIGDQPWEFKVYLPFEYENQPQQREAERLIPLFSPAWCLWSFVFAESNLFYAEVIGIDANTAIGPDDSTAIQTN